MQGTEVSPERNIGETHTTPGRRLSDGTISAYSRVDRMQLFR